MVSELDISPGELLNINPFDFSKSNFYEEYAQEIKISSTYYENENLEIINKYMNKILHSFLTTVSEYDWEKDKIECIGGHIIHELEMLRKLNK